MTKITKKDTFAGLSLLVFSVFIFYPVLFGGKVFSNEEQFGFYYAISHYVKQSITEGTSLLWNSSYYGGVSGSLDQFVSAWYPINRILFSFFDAFTAHHLSVFLGVFLGLLFAYWFGRLQGWLSISSLVFALSYLLATTFGWVQIGTTAAQSFMILPALLISIYYAKEHKVKSLIIPILGGGVALGFGFLGGFIQIVFYICFIAGFYALFLDWSAFKKGNSFFKNWQATLATVLMLLVSFILGARQIFPSAYFIDLTIRSGTYATQNISIPSLTEFLALFLPSNSSLPFLGGGASAGFYLGALGLTFAIIGLFFYRTRTSVFFGLLYLAISGFAFHLPIFSWLNENVPPFSNMGGNFRWMVAAAFPLAFLSGAGIDGFLKAPEKISARGKYFTLLGVWGVSALILLGSFIAQFFLKSVQNNSRLSQWLLDFFLRGRELSYPKEYYQDVFIGAVQSAASMFSIFNLYFFFGIFLWFLASIFFFLAFRPQTRSALPIFIIAFTFLNIVGTFALQFDLMVPKSLFLKKPSIISMLEEREKNPKEYRIMGFLVGDGLYHNVFSKSSFSAEAVTEIHREMLVNNTNIYFGVERMDGLEPYRTRRHNQLLHTVIAADKELFAFDSLSSSLNGNPLNRLENSSVMRRVKLSEKKEDFFKKLPLLSMMNVKYIYSIYELENPNLVLVGVSPLPYTEASPSNVYLYENRAVLPRIYFASRPVFFSGKETDLLQKINQTKDFSKTTLIECGNCQNKPSRSGAGKVEVTRHKNGLLELTTDSPTGGWLIFSESYMPGWVATIDGAEVSIYDANYIFQAILVPNGEHKIVFEYKDIVGLKLKEYLGK